MVGLGIEGGAVSTACVFSSARTVQRIVPSGAAIRRAHYYQAPGRISWLRTILPVQRARPRYQPDSRGDQDSFIEAVESVRDSVHVVGNLDNPSDRPERMTRPGRPLATTGGDFPARSWWSLIRWTPWAFCWRDCRASCDGEYLRCGWHETAHHHFPIGQREK